MPLTVPSALDPSQQREVRELLADLEAEFGREPLSDQALTALGPAAVGESAARHVLAYDADGHLVGYAQQAGSSLEIAARAGTAEQLLAEFPDAQLLVWSHGRRSPLPDALHAHGFTPVRELFQLRRPLTEPVGVLPAPDGVTIVPFVPSRDEDAWLAVNAAAFAHHPEQGGWTRRDLEAREREPWFDPSGFLMAWKPAAQRGDQLLGSHWTKVHADGAGEVYVIGVAPQAQGLGLGKVLLQQGLAYLQNRGCAEVLLYVDGDNTSARRLYANSGFAEYDLDVQWSRVS